MATKRWKNGKWEFTVRRAGLLPKPRSFRFADEDEGDRYIRRLEALLDRGEVPEELIDRGSPSPRLREHVRKYLASQHVSSSDRACLNNAVGRLPAELELRDMTFAWATAWVSRMKREDNLSPSTIRHHVGALARCLDWLAVGGWLPMNPLRLLSRGYAMYTPEDGRLARENEGKAKSDEERERRLQPGEEDRIRAVLGGGKPVGRQRPLALRHADALRVLFDLALETGMRMREMYTIDRAQVDLEASTIFLDKTKNGDKRQVPLTSVAKNLLRAFMPPSGLVFPWWDGTEKSLPRTTSRLSRQFGRIFSAAECVDLRFHDLRHEATSRLFERTSLSDTEVAKITGHKDPRMLRRYANLRASTLAEKLW